MRSFARRAALPGLCLAALMVLGGCASAPVRFYSLAAPGQPAAPAAATVGGKSPMFVEFAPLALPQRLARPQLVVRKADAETSARVEVLEDYRWASSFQYELRDALANRVAGQLGAINSTVSGRPPDQPAWRIFLQVQSFDAVLDRRIDVDLNWSVRRTDGGADASICRWSGSEQLAPGMDALAQGAQRLTERAADAIARQLAALAAGTGPGCG